MSYDAPARRRRGVLARLLRPLGKTFNELALSRGETERSNNSIIIVITIVTRVVVGTIRDKQEKEMVIS